MDLLRELFFSYLRSEDFKIESLEGLDVERVIENECYKALKGIKEIISDDEIEDKDCFERIEEIVCLLENMGIDLGGRHDF